MPDVLQIFRKDVRHLWPRILAVLAVTALWGWMECEMFTPSPVIELVRGLWILSAAFLAVSVIHEERLPGHNQYWLTRPYSIPRLVVAKLVFVLVFLCLPMFLMGAVALAVNGFSPWRHTGRLAAQALIFAGGIAAVVAALASVTENFVQLLWALIPAIGLVSLGLMAAGAPANWEWGSLEWIRSLALGSVVVLAAMGVVALQYWRRNTVVARCVLGAVILFAAGGPFLGSWHSAWALQTRGGSQDAVRLAFDAARKPETGFTETPWTPEAAETGINLPVRVEAIPPGTVVVSQRVSVRIEAPDRQPWTSAWSRSGGLCSIRMLEDPHVIPIDGAYQQYFAIDRDFYESVKNMPVHLHTTVALTLLGQQKSVTLVTRTLTSYHSDDGACRVRVGPLAKLEVACAWVAHTPARSYVKAVSVRNGLTYSALISDEFPGPLPLTGSVWDRASTLFSIPSAHEIQLETWQAVALFDRELDVPTIRLADYAVRRLTDVP